MEAWSTPQNILSLALLLVTLAYTITSVLTWLESKATRKQKNAPNIIAYLRSNASHDTLYVCVKNIGEGCATHVRAIPTIDYAIFGRDKHLRDFSLFSDGINVFPPQFELIFPLNSWSNIRNEDNPSIKLDVHYKDLSGHSYYHHYCLIFEQLVTNEGKP